MVSEMYIGNNIIEIIHNPSYMRKNQYKGCKNNFLYLQTEYGEITTQLLKQGLLCKPRTLSSAASRGVKAYHQHDFALLIID